MNTIDLSNGSKEQLRVLLVEGRQSSAEALGFFLEHHGIASTKIAVTDQEALRLTGDPPHVVVIDAGESDLTPLGVGEALLQRSPGLRVLALAGPSAGVSAQEIKDRGFHGFVGKDASLAELVGAIKRVAEGEDLFSEEEGSVHVLDDTTIDTNALLVARQLTLREHEVLVLLVQGASSDEMAADLGIMMNTVRTHVQNILTKFQVHTRLQAVMFAVRHGLVKMAEEESQQLGGTPS
jgi:DNA-binding NarL/FixJ family response regulator